LQEAVSSSSEHPSWSTTPYQPPMTIRSIPWQVSSIYLKSTLHNVIVIFKFM